MSGVRVLVGTAKDAFILTATERYRAQLHQLKDWDEFLLRHSGLPGPRGNLELAQAVAMALQRWFGVVDPDVRWAMKENLKKKRLVRVDADWVAMWLAALAG